MPAIRTLQDFHETGRSIRAHCTHYYECNHDAVLQLELVALRLGWGFDFYKGRDYLAGRLRCSICGWRYPVFSLGHAVAPPNFAGSHGAGTVPLSHDDMIALQRAREANIAGEMPWVGVRKGGRKFGR